MHRNTHTHTHTRVFGPFLGDISPREMPPTVSSDHQAAVAPPPSPRRGTILPQSPLRIKQDGKFYERLLSKESSGNLSFRYYWAEPGSVPFVWETQPGTPKDVAGMAAGVLPAITPPPAYVLRHGTSNKVVAASRHQQSKKKQGKKGCRLRRIRIGFIAGIFRRLSLMNKAWRRPVKQGSSSSTRWLFCSVATTERGEHDERRENETAAPARQQNSKTVICGGFRRARPSPWLPRFRSAGNRGGWA